MHESRSTGTVDRLRIRVDDEERLEVLRSFKILDTPPEPEYERLVDLIHPRCRGAWTVVTLVDRDRQWFKAMRGLDQRETPRSISFCSVGMQQRMPLVVENALLDPRFRDNYLVREKGLRFFAGCPLFSSEGYALGSVSVIDMRPRTLMSHQMTLLEQAQRWVQADLDRRRNAIEWQAGLHCTTSEERRLGEQRFALKKYVAEQAWAGVTAAAETWAFARLEGTPLAPAAGCVRSQPKIGIGRGASRESAAPVRIY